MSRDRSKTILVIVAFVLINILIGLFVYNHACEGYYLLHWLIADYLLALIGFFVVWGELEFLISIQGLAIGALLWWFTDTAALNNIVGNKPTIIVYGTIKSHYSLGNKVGRSTYAVTEYTIGKHTKEIECKANNIHDGGDLYAYWAAGCPNSYMLAYITNPNNRQKMVIGNFGFMEEKKFYSYYKYSLKNPDLVYYQVGFNVVYMATHDSVCHSDTSAVLRFTDICGKSQSIKYSVRKYDEVPDTFLVYKNINEDVDDRFIVCDKSVNTPDNWHKISDYGYIFNYDVYSKDSVESQCPRIREYVEKYKERNMKK